MNLKVLCLVSENLDQVTMGYWKNAFQKLGAVFEFWNPRYKPAFDIFDEYQPDLFIGTTKDITKGLAKCLIEQPDITILLYSLAGDVTVDKEEIDTVDRLCEMRQSGLNCIFDFSCNFTGYNNWKEIGYKTINVPRGYDETLFYPTEPDNDWICDLTFVGDRTDYLADYILPLCGIEGLKFRIYGNGWNIPQCVGSVKQKNLRKVFSSSKITLNITTTPWELSDTFFSSIASGGFCLSNSATYLAGKDIHVKPPEEFKDIVTYFLLGEGKDSMQPISLKLLGKSEKHTYHTIISSLLKQLQLT